ncbi:hypothetical protein V5O48_012454 [Marasmius crinis-equi]|uniref:Retrotransposon gag domain-containing protein n=1 Tax=Marasmius crinis-equi TaxID=585013 RepID=A0ABR3F2R3_9AGAR
MYANPDFFPDRRRDESAERMRTALLAAGWMPNEVERAIQGDRAPLAPQEGLTGAPEGIRRSPPRRREEDYDDWELRERIKDEREARKERINLQSKLNLKRPDSFSGDDRAKFDVFLQQLANTFTSQPDIYATPESKIAYASSYLSGAAHSHQQMLQYKAALGNRVIELQDWAAWVEEFREMFGERNLTFMAQGRLQNVKQKPDEDFTDFYVRFLEQATKSQFGDEALLWTLLMNMNEATMAELRRVNYKPTTYKALQTKLWNIDSTEQAYDTAGLAKNQQKTTPMSSYWSTKNTYGTTTRDSASYSGPSNSADGRETKKD